MAKAGAEFRLAPAARSDLEGIWLYGLDKWGIEQADRYIDQLEEKLAWLAENPKLVPACDHIRTGYRSGEVGSHIIYFQITDYGIAVIRILHVRMDEERHL